MGDDSTKALGRVIRIDESEIRGQLNELVRGTVEQTLNGLLDAEADDMCPAQRYERSAERVDTRAGHYLEWPRTCPLVPGSSSSL